MVVKHCAHGMCKSDSRYMNRPGMENVQFVKFPDPVKQRAKCKRWVNACHRVDFELWHVTAYTYICTKHFVGESLPTDEYPDPISAAITGEELEKLKRLNQVKKPNLMPITKNDGPPKGSACKPVARASGECPDQNHKRDSDPRLEKICNASSDLSCTSANFDTPSIWELFCRELLNHDFLPTLQQDALTVEGLVCEPVASPSTVQHDQQQQTESSPQYEEICHTSNVSRTSLPVTTPSVRKSPVFGSNPMNNFMKASLMMEIVRKGWLVGNVQGTNMLTFSMAEDNVIKRTVWVDTDKETYVVKLIGKVVKGLPVESVTTNNLLAILNSVQQYEVCEGVWDQSISTYDHQKCVLCPFSQKIRSIHCSAIVACDKLCGRCPSCTSQKRKLLKSKIRRLKKEPTNSTLMTKTQLISYIRRQATAKRLLLNKLKQAKYNLQKLRRKEHF